MQQMIDEVRDHVKLNIGPYLFSDDVEINVNFHNDFPVVTIGNMTKSRLLDTSKGEQFDKYFRLISEMNECKYFKGANGDMPIFISVSGYTYNPDIVTLKTSFRCGFGCSIKLALTNMSFKKPIIVRYDDYGWQKYRQVEEFIIYPLDGLHEFMDENIETLFPRIILPNLCELFGIKTGSNIKQSLK